MRNRILIPIWALVCVGFITACENSTEPASPEAGTPPVQAVTEKQLPPGMTLEEADQLRQRFASAAPLAAVAPPSWESDFGQQLVGIEDDGCRLFAAGLAFEFYGVTYNDLFVNSNGNVSFAACNFSFGPFDIPDPLGRVILGVLYGDFNPTAGGAVYINVLGDAPSRRAVITWSQVPEYLFPSGYGSNTFQIQLFEGSNAIQFGYNGLTTDGLTYNVMNVGIASGSDLFEHTASGTPDPSLLPISALDGTNICYKPNGPSDYDVTLGPCTFGPELITVDIDIKPWSSRNLINLASRGVIPVAILGSADFDVASVDVTTLAFGPGEAPPAHKAHGLEWDINHDGFKDLITHYRTQASGIAVGDTEACVTGLTLDGAEFEGCDAVEVKDRKKKRRHWWWWW